MTESTDSGNYDNIDYGDMHTTDGAPFVPVPVDVEVLPSSTELVDAAKNAPAASPQNKAQRFRTEISDADKRLFNKLPDVIDKLVKKALEGNGDTKLLMYVVDRCLGRPTEHQEVSATTEFRALVTAEQEKMREVPADELARQYLQENPLGA